MTRIGEAKRRALQIPLDHFRGGGLAAAKWGFAALAAVAVTAWLAAGYLRSDHGALRYSPAPVAAVHQAWETECAACHVPFAPIRDDAAFASWPVHHDARGGDDDAFPWGRAADRLCQSCHAGPEHHPTQIPKEVVGCASCHHEHQGRDADLTRVADRACTVCHADLPAHTRDVGSIAKFDPPIAEHVTSFAGDHPEFRSLANDPGTIRFTHGRHMSPGLAPANSSEPPFTLDRIAPEDRERYAAYVADPQAGVVQLQCNACHQGEANGAYMAPVSFDRDCRGCHALTLPVIAETGDFLRVPHGLTLREARGVILEALLREPREEDARRQSATLQDVKPDAEPVADVVDEARILESRADSLARELSGECNKCHTMIDKADSDLGPTPHVAPPRIPQNWFAHAHFSHAAHQTTSCSHCHPGAEVEANAGEDPASSHRQVMIAGRKVCIECHRPQPADGSAGARHDCALCHRYHAGPRPGVTP